MLFLKVLECLVLRFAKNKVIFCEAYVTVMIRLHLAHGKKITILFEYECLNIVVEIEKYKIIINV